MKVTIEQLHQIPLFSELDLERLLQLQADAVIKQYLRGEVILLEGDRLPDRLITLLSGRVEVKKTNVAGKETILRIVHAGQLIVPPVLIGNFFASATIVAEQNSQILTIDRIALLAMIQQTPELMLQLVAILTELLQSLHQVVHGLASERAIVRLAQFIQTAAISEGSDVTERGLQLRSRSSHYQIACSIGITYEECVRLFKQIRSIVNYSRGGTILVLDRAKLDAIANGHTQ